MNFEDEKLALVIRETVGLGSEGTTPDITVKDLNTVTELNLENKNIEDISGIEYIANLESLNLSNNAVVDITPLETMQELKTIDLSNNHIETIDSLKELKNVDVLNLDNNHILDLEQVAVFSNLNIRNKSLNNQTLNLKTPVEIKDSILKKEIISSLGLSINTETLTIGDMSKLTTFNLENKGIVSLDGLEYATNLTTLNVKKNNLTDLTPLKDLTKLTTLNVSYNNLLNATITNLASMTGLKNLDISWNNLTDASVEYLNKLPIATKNTIQKNVIPTSSVYTNGLFDTEKYTISGQTSSENILDNNPDTYFRFAGSNLQTIMITFENSFDIYRFYYLGTNDTYDKYDYSDFDFIDASGKVVYNEDMAKSGSYEQLNYFKSVDLKNVKKIKMSRIGNNADWIIKEFEVFGFPTS